MNKTVMFVCELFMKKGGYYENQVIRMLYDLN